MLIFCGQPDPMAHSSAKPKTLKFDLNEFKSTDSQTHIILLQNQNRENDVFACLIDSPNPTFRTPRLAQRDSLGPGP